MPASRWDLEVSKLDWAKSKPSTFVSFFWLMSLQKNIKDICFEDVEMVSLKFLAG